MEEQKKQKRIRNSFKIVIDENEWKVVFRVFNEKVTRCDIFDSKFRINTPKFVVSAVAKCNIEEDTFDAIEGKIIAFDKAHIKLLDMLEKRKESIYDKRSQEILNIEKHLDQRFGKYIDKGK